MPNPHHHTPPTPDQLKQAREAAGLTQSGLAAVMLDLDPATGTQLINLHKTIQRWEQGSTEPSPAYTRILSKLLPLTDQESQP